MKNVKTKVNEIPVFEMHNFQNVAIKASDFSWMKTTLIKQQEQIKHLKGDLGEIVKNTSCQFTKDYAIRVLKDHSHDKN